LAGLGNRFYGTRDFFSALCIINMRQLRCLLVSYSIIRIIVILSLVLCSFTLLYSIVSPLMLGPLVCFKPFLVAFLGAARV
jgi:hypothetical protein